MFFLLGIFIVRILNLSFFFVDRYPTLNSFNLFNGSRFERRIGFTVIGERTSFGKSFSDKVQNREIASSWIHPEIISGRA